MEYDAANIMRAKNTIIPTFLEISKLEKDKRGSGIAGTKYFLVRKTVVKEGIAKTKAA
jgi:hypothetical protein